MVADGLRGGHLAGNLVALGAASAFAVMVIAMRGARDRDMVPASCLGGVLAALLCLPLTLTLAEGLVLSRHDLALSVLLGTVQVGAGFLLITLATRHVPAAEVALLALSEVVLGADLGLDLRRRGAERPGDPGRRHRARRGRRPGAPAHPPGVRLESPATSIDGVLASAGGRFHVRPARSTVRRPGASMTEKQHETDVVIIGAGPVGLFAVFELGMLKIRCHVIDSLDGPGGQCTALYPEKPIYDIPGTPEILAGELIERLRQQAAPFRPALHLGERVESLERDGASWRVATSGGTTITCTAVVIAAGAGAFGPNRPPLPGIRDYEGRGVYYSVARREDFRDKRLVIAGGGDSALDWTLSLAEVAAKIYVVHRRAKFRGAPDSVARLQRLAEDGKVVELVVPFQLQGLDGQDGTLAAVRVRSLEDEERRLEADALLAFFGLASDLGPIAEWGLELAHRAIKVDPATCETSRPGIFAIGDINSYPGKLKLILCGFSEAAMAAHAIRPLIYPDQELHWEYSTTKGLPGQP